MRKALIVDAKYKSSGFVGHFPYSVHLGSWRISDEALADLAAGVVVLLDGHVDLFPQEIIEALGLHLS